MELERDANPAIGPAFLVGEDGQPKFRYVVDKSSIIGPRAVTQADRDAYPAHWAEFVETNPEPAPDAAPSPKAKPAPKPKAAKA